MKRFKTLLLAAIVLFAAVPLFAEAVFLKDGEIIEGRIISDTDKAIEIREGLRTREIPRDDVLRILYSDDYKQRQYIYTTDDREISGHIVAEDRNTYTIRRELKSPDEFTIQKSSVTGVMSRSIRDARPDADYTGTGVNFALGVYFKVSPPEGLGVGEGEQMLYEHSLLGILANVDFAPRYPVHIRGAFLYSLDNDMGPGDNNYDDSIGLEIMFSAGFTLYDTGKFRFWAGPMVGFMYRKLEWDDDDWSMVGIFAGIQHGFDYSITDSLFFTMDIGLRITMGSMEHPVEPDGHIEYRGQGFHIGLGMMYRF